MNNTYRVIYFWDNLYIFNDKSNWAVCLEKWNQEDKCWESISDHTEKDFPLDNKFIKEIEKDKKEVLLWMIKICFPEINIIEEDGTSFGPPIS